jgi:phosphoribosylformylglycinamidine synthase
MASRGGVGLDIDVAKIPAREDAMKPFEFMVSESQERMLAVVTPDNLDAARAVCEKWGLRSTVIGEVTSTGRFVVREGDEVVGDMPAATLASDAPIYDPEMRRPAYLDEVQAFDVCSLPHPSDPAELGDVLLRVLASPNVCSRAWIYRQYDQQVMLNTLVLPGSDAGVLRIADTGTAIAVSSDCNGRYCYLDPYVGAQIAFAEAARNVACAGGHPAAITDCLNFGNPEKPEVFWTFFESVRGMADACGVFGVPVISGNVSFYNESFGNPIYPTPTVGLVGVLEDAGKRVTMAFKDAGDVIVLLGETEAELGGSEYLSTVHGVIAGAPPAIVIEDELEIHRALLEAIDMGLVKSAHDCSEGGVAVALAESAIGGGVGASVALDDDLAPVFSLFSETQGRIVLTCSEDFADALTDLFVSRNVPFSVIGEVVGDRLTIEDKVDVSLDRLRDAWVPTLERLVVGDAPQSEELVEG